MRRRDTASLRPMMAADCFVHISAVIASGIWDLATGQAIGYDLLVARNGKISAINLHRP
jgi:CspA family cold shock protein